MPTAIGIKLLEIKSGVLEWALDILQYQNTNKVLDDRQRARKIRYQAARYTVVDGVLYRRGYNAPLLRCISNEWAQHVLAKIHEEIYNDHAERRVLAGKTM